MKSTDPARMSNEAILAELGELLAQYLAVSIDPYPRAADAAPRSAIENEDAVVERRSNRPFEALAVLKKNHS